MRLVHEDFHDLREMPTKEDGIIKKDKGLQFDDISIGIKLPTSVHEIGA